MNILFDMHLFSGLLMLAMPVGLGVYLTRRFKLGWRLWWIGAAGFVISQVGHIPFNSLLNLIFTNGILPISWVQNAVGQAVVVGLSAGLWEELTRAGIFRLWAKDARSWRKSVLLGAGHGGIEAIILAVVVLGTFFYMTALRGMDLSTVVPAEQLALAQQQVEGYWSTPATISILGSVERALTIPIHICFSVLVLQAFTRKQPWWVGLAIFWHALLDAAVVYFGIIWKGNAWNPYALEGVLAVFTLISVVLIFVLRRPEPSADPDFQADEPALTAPGLEPGEIQLDVTNDDLDRSRFV